MLSCSLTLGTPCAPSRCRPRGSLLPAFRVPQKIPSVLLLILSILELGMASSSTFLGSQATVCYTWRVSGSARSLWDRTGTPLLCSQGVDRAGKEKEGRQEQWESGQVTEVCPPEPHVQWPW